MIPVRNAVHILGNRYFPYQEGKVSLAELLEEQLPNLHNLLHELLWLTSIFKKVRQKKEI